MWILLNDSFLSIVTDLNSRRDPRELLVRARVPGDIERVFPEAVVRAGEGWDYPFRATVPRETVAEALASRVRDIDYPNFKDSVHDGSRRSVFGRVWSALRALQE